VTFTEAARALSPPRVRGHEMAPPGADHDGEEIGKLEDVYVDVENGEPQFTTVKEGFIAAA
jgi:uncharacterized protein YrrD